MKANLPPRKLRWQAGFVLYKAFFSPFSVSAQEFTSARKIDKAGCGRGFYDIGTGDCYERPSGYKRYIYEVYGQSRLRFSMINLATSTIMIIWQCFCFTCVWNRD
jgi:hypothetical protein